MGDRAGRWLRVSGATQDEKNQVPDIDGHIGARGYEAARTYTLHGKSASKGEQEPALAEAIRDIESGAVTVIVAWSLDRLDRRGIAQSFATKIRIEEAGGRVEFAKEPTMSELEFAIKAHIAHEESKRKAERSRMGLDAARVNGAVTFRAPWGYRVDGPKRGKRFVPTSEGRKVVPLVFSAVADGMSITEAAARFCPPGAKWSAMTMGRMIRNLVYRGTVTDASGKVVHKCEALVDAALWARANKAVTDPERKKRGANPKSPVSGVLRCAVCGGIVYRIRDARRPGQDRYRCRDGCGLEVPARLLEPALDRLAASAFARPVTKWEKIPGHGYEAEIEQVEWELRELPKQGLDEDAEDARRAELRDERKRLRSLPVVPDEWREIETGQNYSDVWAATPEHERAAWLKKNRFRLWADRDSLRVAQSAGPWDNLPEILPPFWPASHEIRKSGPVALAVPLRP